MMKIIASAIKAYPKDSKYPIIVCGKRHCNCLEILWNSKIEFDKSKTIQGFYTNNDRFLDRYEAAILALENNQMLPYSETLDKMREDMLDNYGQLTRAYELFSEDLW